mgnify:CR=1 FL=1
MKLRVLSADDVRRALPMAEAVVAMKAAFAQLSAGRANVPLRTPIEVPAHDGVTLFMPAYLADDDQMAVKIVSVFNANPATALSASSTLTTTGRFAVYLPLVLRNFLWYYPSVDKEGQR